MKKSTAGLCLVFVVLLWGVSPLFTSYQYRYFSPVARMMLAELMMFVGFLPLAVKGFKTWRLRWKAYMKAALVTGLCTGLANALQKVGLAYTTPAKYAFLENLSCVIVPFAMWWLASQKPSAKTVLASVICLIGAFVLNGISLDSMGHWGIGEILCAAAGIVYGLNIAFTGIYVNKLDVGLLLCLRTGIISVGYLIYYLINNVLILPGHATVNEVSLWPADRWQYVWLFLLVFFTSVVGWALRSECMKYISANAVAVIMPFSSVITGIVSVLAGKDTLSFALVGGCVLILAAVLLSAVAEKEDAHPIDDRKTSGFPAEEKVRSFAKKP